MRITKEREERKHEILSISRRMILEKGYNNTSIDEIVKEINVAKGLFYYYFPKKSSIIEALSENLLEELIFDLDNVIYNPKLNYSNKLNLLLLIYFSKVEENGFLVPLYESHISEKNSLETKLKNLASEYAVKILKENPDFIKNNKFPEYTVKVIIGGFSDLYREGIRNKEIYSDLIEEFLGVKIE